MLVANLETTLDKKEISFIEMKESMEDPKICVQQYQMKVWDKNFLTSYVAGFREQSWEYNGHVFSFPNGNDPFTCVLSCQVQLCYYNAVRQVWVSKDNDRP